jgi:hypothetical protein
MSDHTAAEIDAASARLVSIAAVLLHASYNDDPEQMSESLRRGAISVKREADALRATRVTSSGEGRA